MSSLKRIATDIDETLFCMMPAFSKVLMAWHGAVVLPVDGYQIKTNPAVSEEGIWNIFYHLYKYHDLCEPYPGAKEYLEKIYNITRKPPIIITSRPEGWESETHDQVRHMVGDLPFHLINAGVPAKKKYLYASNFDIIVDDRIETVTHLVETCGKLGIVVDRPWNKQDPGMTGFAWHQFKFMIRVGGVADITPFLPLLLAGTI